MFFIALLSLSALAASAEQIRFSIDAKTCADRMEKRSHNQYICPIHLEGDPQFIVRGEEVRMKFANCTIEVKPEQNRYSLSLTKDSEGKRMDFLRANANNCLSQAIEIGNLDKNELEVIIVR